MEDESSSGTHDLLLALAGRVDDDLLAWARELVAVGEHGHAIQLLAASLIAERAALPPPVRTALVDAARSARSDLDPATALPPAQPEDGTEHRFGPAPAGDDPVSAALLALPARQLHSCSVLLARRLTPAGSAPGPLPHPVVLLEVREGTRPADVLAYQLAVALQRAGVRASVEVLPAGARVPDYHAEALRRARPIRSEGDGGSLGGSGTSRSAPLVAPAPSGRGRRHALATPPDDDPPFDGATARADGATARFEDADRVDSDRVDAGRFDDDAGRVEAETPPARSGAPRARPGPPRGGADAPLFGVDAPRRPENGSLFEAETSLFEPDAARAEAAPPRLERPQDRSPVPPGGDRQGGGSGTGEAAGGHLPPTGASPTPFALPRRTVPLGAVRSVFEPEPDQEEHAADREGDGPRTGPWSNGSRDDAPGDPRHDADAAGDDREAPGADDHRGDESPGPQPSPRPQPPRGEASPRPAPRPVSGTRPSSVTPLSRAHGAAPVPLPQRTGATAVPRPFAPASEGANGRRGEVVEARPDPEPDPQSALATMPNFDPLNDPLDGRLGRPLLEPSGGDDGRRATGRQPGASAPTTNEDSWSGEWLSGAWAMPPSGLDGVPPNGEGERADDAAGRGATEQRSARHRQERTPDAAPSTEPPTLTNAQPASGPIPLPPARRAIPMPSGRSEPSPQPGPTRREAPPAGAAPPGPAESGPAQPGPAQPEARRSEAGRPEAPQPGPPTGPAQRVAPPPAPRPRPSQPGSPALPTGEQPDLGLRPESLARLSDADRQLLARLQAELLDGGKPRVSRTAGIGGTTNANGSANGSNGNGGGGPHQADPPNLAG